MYDPRLRHFSQSLSPAAVAANTTAEEIFAVSYIRLDDIILSVNKPTAQAGLGIVGYRVSSEGNIAITFSNNTGSSITPTASESYLIATMVRQP